MRHAKSDWEAGAASDHERPLNDRGKREAPSVGKRLAELHAVPELVISSDAARTRETWDRIRGSFPHARLELEPSFYLAGLEAVRERFATVPDDVGTVLILGHNPGWEQLASELTGTQIELKTAYAAILESRGDDDQAWTEALRHGGFTLKKVVKPGS
jgi:phosphohistidine phosphatase